MADIEFGDMAGTGAYGRGKTASFFINWTGGLLSLALIAGSGVWGYKLLVRDVTGVPVIQALAGPVRVAPEDPGGELAQHQGLSVNEVAGGAVASQAADKVLLAPAAQNLASEDLPKPALEEEIAQEMARAKAEEESNLPAYGEAVEDPSLYGASVVASQDDLEEEGIDSADAGPIDDQPEDALATDMAVAEALGVSPTGDPRADALALADAVSRGAEPLTAEPAVARRDSRGLAVSRRPMLRPADFTVQLASAPAAPMQVETVSAEAGEIPAEQIAAGTRLVQLGAFDSPETARDQWDKIGGRFEEYFAGKRRVVQRAVSGGKTFYRLRAMGFEDLSDARRFCSALVARQADCIPVVVR